MHLERFQVQNDAISMVVQRFCVENYAKSMMMGKTSMRGHRRHRQQEFKKKQIGSGLALHLMRSFSSSFFIRSLPRSRGQRGLPAQKKLRHWTQTSTPRSGSSTAVPAVVLALRPRTLESAGEGRTPTCRRRPPNLVRQKKCQV